MVTQCGVEGSGTTKLKLSAIPDDRPVKVTVQLPGAVGRDLVAYAELLDPAKLIAPMLIRLMTDRSACQSPTKL